MKIQYQHHALRRRKIMRKWIKIATDYLGGMTAIDIAKRYSISRAYVYYILKKLKDTPIN